ncbi:MAG TPA: hypothetical protein VE861_16760 [Gemmatimonadaceae bacterium]|nr:hypothetical protein [Gemmatimonadaceae bacterium]
MNASPLRRLAAAPSGVNEDTERLFEQLATQVAPSYANVGRLQSAGDVASAAIDAAWDAARVISFDIFDTLIVRKVASPRDVFLHLATPAPFSAWGLEPQQLAAVRQEAENRARGTGVQLRKSSEVSLTEIHTVIAGIVGRPVSEVPAMVRAEQLVELALCIAHPHLKDVFARAIASGKAVWCVSDTYHDATFLRELLTSCGFALDGVEIISSADRRMSKGEGRLLMAVAKAASVRPADVLHVGDHPHADFAIPAAQGFVAVCHPWAGSRHDDARATAPGDSIALGLSQIASRTVHPAFPFWWRFGYAIAGPMLSSFAFWLQQRFAADGIDRAYFLLRDGEIILDVYRALTGDRGGPATSLLESSRRAFVMPALAAGSSSITSQLLACENARPAREFLDRFGVRSGDFKSAFRAVGLYPDTVVGQNDVDGMTKVMSLMQRNDVATALMARSKVERQLLMQYLDQEQVLAAGRTAVVDIGWSGTIQKALVAAAKLEGRSLDVHGYYLGTLPTIAEDLGGSQASGYLFDHGAPADHASAVLQLRQLVEFICTTERGSLRGFKLEGKRVVPVHGSVDHPERQRAAMAQLRDGALAYARALAQEQVMFGQQPISANAAMRHLARTILDPTAEEAVEIGGIRHGDGLGSDRLRALATFSEGPFTPESLLRDHAGAYWPRGLLARREPAAMALRALLWLRSA